MRHRAGPKRTGPKAHDQAHGLPRRALLILVQPKLGWMPALSLQSHSRRNNLNTHFILQRLEQPILVGDTSVRSTYTPASYRCHNTAVWRGQQNCHERRTKPRSVGLGVWGSSRFAAPSCCHDCSIRWPATKASLPTDENTKRDFIPNPNDHLAAFTEFHHYLTTHYQFDRKIDKLDIYRRTDFVPSRL